MDCVFNSTSEFHMKKRVVAYMSAHVECVREVSTRPRAFPNNVFV